MYEWTTGTASKLNATGSDFIECPLKYNDLKPTVGKLREPKKAAIKFVREKVFHLIKHALNGHVPGYSDKLIRANDVHSEGYTETYKLEVTVDGKTIPLGFVWQLVEIINFSASPDSELLNTITPLLKIAGLGVERETL